MEYMRGLPDKAFDLALVDPPYFKGPNERGFYGDRVSSIGVRRVDYPSTSSWEVPGSEYFAELIRVSRNQIVWGANHFISALPINSPAWIVWDKCNAGSDFADVELAWTSFGSAARLFAFMWNGMLQGSPEDGRKMQGNKALNEKRIHPTQKPVALYRWLLQKYAKPGQRILDTHLGSGSIAIACDIEGFDLVGCEIDADYIAGARKRLAEHQAQPRLFVEKREEPQQLRAEL